MGQAEELLNSVTRNVQVHTHTLIDPDTYFIIDPTTREIENASRARIVLMQYDHNSELFTFELPRYVEGHDMTLCNRVRVHYNNIDGENNEEHPDVAELTDLAVSESDDEKVVCTWLISRNATQIAGTLNFLVQYMCVADDGHVMYDWHTDIFSKVYINPGRNYSEQVVADYADVLEQWYQRLFGRFDKTLTVEGAAADAKAVGEALEKKANKTLRVTVDWVDATSSYTSSHSLQEILEHWNNGDDVVCEYGTRVFGLTSINEYAAVFAYKTVSKTSVQSEWFSIDSNGAVQHDYNTYYNKVDSARTKDGQNPQVGQAVTVKELDRYGNISAYETVDLPKSATVDKTLSIEGASADAKVVGEELDKKAPKRLIINLSSTGVINTYQADKTLEEVRECYQNGSEVVIEHYSGRYECTAVYDTNAYFFTAADVSDTVVRKIRAVMDVNGIVTTSCNDYVNKVDTARTKDDGIPRVGQVIAVKSVNRYNRIEEYETVDLPSIDATLSVEGQAADAKAVGKELGKKEPLVLRVAITGNPPGPYTSSHSASEIIAHYNAGGSVVATDYTGHQYGLLQVNDSSVRFESSYVTKVYGNVYYAVNDRYEVFDDKSVTYTPFNTNITASDGVGQFMTSPVTGKGVYNYAIPIPTAAEVGQTIVVDAVDENGKPIAWKAVDMASSTPKEKTLQVTIEFVRGAYIASHSLAQIREYKESGWKITARSMHNTELELEKLGDYSARFEKLYMLQYGSDHFELKYEQITINNGDDRSAYYSNYSRNLTAIDFVASGDKRYVTGGAVYDYAVPIPATAEVGQVLSVKAVDDNGKPIEWEPVDMSGGGAVELDATLSVEGAAADAKAVGDALADKAKKPLIINADDAPTTGSNSVSGIPIFTIDYSPADLKAYADAGGSVTVVRYNRHYTMYDATEETAKFRFIEATDMQVDWYHAVLDVDKNISITRTSHKSRMETTTGGAVGQIPIIKSLDTKGRPASFEFGNMPNGIPACSASDDGKFLRVVGGVAAWATIPNAEGVGF